MPFSHHLLRSTICIQIGILYLSQLTSAQQDSSQLIPEYYQYQIEAVLDQLESDEDFDFNSLGENLENLRASPISLNQATQSDLESLHLLSDQQVSEFLFYRSNLGDFISIYELQAIPLFDQYTIDKILPYVTLNEAPVFDIKSMVKMLTDGRNELYLRASRFIEKQKGYQSINGADPKYLGDPNQYYIRFKHQFEQNMSYGLTLEKDPGEPFLTESGTKGFDYTGFHLFVKNLNQRIETLALGDYSVSLGQGLIMHSGFGGAKSSFTTLIKRGGKILRPYTAVNESAALRGLAATINLKPITVTLFASKRKRDGNTQIDTSDNYENIQSFTSLQLSGLHRTQLELDDRRTIDHQLVGGRITMEKGSISAGFNLTNNHFNQSFSRIIKPYNQFYFTGQNLTNASFDYSYRLKNLHFFGEIAASDNKALAMVNGLMMGLSRYVDLAVLYRNFSPRYQALFANSFAETSQTNNEKGIYLGSQIRINPSLQLSLYADYWIHPWLRFNVDAPSTGSEHFIRLTYIRRKIQETYIQFRSEIKGYNQSGIHLNKLLSGKRSYLRMHHSFQMNKNIEFRNRVEFSIVNTRGNYSHGFLIYQDIIFKSIRFPLSFTSRICYFDTDDYSSRIYSYENDILYSFSIPPFFDQGLRYYLNLRYRWKALTLEARYEQTRYRDLSVIGSGNGQIDGNTKSRIKVQCRISF